MIWVWIETLNGKALDASLELLNPGRRIADTLGAKLAAVVLGHNAEQAAQTAAAYGADQVILVDDAALAAYNAETYTAAMHSLVQKYGPDTVLFGATSNGRDFAPRVAARLQTGLTADCTGLDTDPETGIIQWTRPAFGGSLMAVIECPKTRPQMGTVRPGIFACPGYKPERTAEVIRESVSLLPTPRARIIESLGEVADDKASLEDAENIIAGGRGLGKAENFALLYELAQALGAGVAASRGAVDAGWISRAHQVGQTGKTVRPKLYIACGISGAAQHMAGISGAGTIVAVNSDPEAPIFRFADYGVVGDLRVVLPALADEIRRMKNESGN